MRGRIVKGIAGFYYVSTGNSGIYECKARGIFRKNNKKPLVGDLVEIKITDEEQKLASITDILPRKNELIRPAIANVDQVMLLFALKDPDPDPGLLDRFLVMVEMQKIPAFLVFNKCDLCPETEAESWKRIYSNCRYPIYFTCFEKNIGTDALKEQLAGKVTVAAGPSGVGKSTLTNLLQDEIRMETGQISKKLGRGKHTTRHSELIYLFQDTYLCDTPGFTALSTQDIAKEKLQYCFPEFAPYQHACRFAGCAHRKEPDCKVKEAVEKGEISAERYAHYVKMYSELEEREKRRY